jgi:hypothetical protein
MLKMIKKLFIVISLVSAAFFAVAQDAPIYQSEAYTIYPRKVVQAEEHASIVADNAITSTFEMRKWVQQHKAGRYPVFSCEVPIGVTAYNLALDELEGLIEPDSTWRTGKWWGGVWTRDVSYSSLLALSYLNTDVTRVSLMKRVRGGRILQDTGTGGSWPVSTDHAVWVLAGWQMYLVTGDKQWVKQCYEIASKTLLQDEAVAYDPATGLMRGESSFLDWREESYPRWMQPADIAMSECLGTNALFFRANQITARMAQLCGDYDGAAHFSRTADRIKDGINNHLWIEEKGYYGQYLYGRGHLILSPRSETLGEALCILFGIAEPARAKRMVASIGQTPFGTPCIQPQIPNIYPYHNNAVWPFVQAYWMWASALTGNSLAVSHSIASIYRPAALFATNQENFVAETGDYHTAMNSPSMLWSIAGNISVVHRVLVGINFEEEGINFRPCVPTPWGGNKTLKNFKYRKAVLDITVQGYGDKVSACYIDGRRQAVATVPASLTGRHTVKLVMNNAFSNLDRINNQPVITSPETPQAYLDGSTRLAWRQVPNAKEYKIVRDGKVIATQPERIINGNRYDIPVGRTYTEYQVIAVSEEGYESFASEPVAYYNYDNELRYDMTRFAAATQFAPCKGYTGNGAVEIATKVNTRIEMKVEVLSDGEYLLDFQYANGSNNLTDADMCAVRTLSVGGSKVGTVVFPQRGRDLWTLWGYSSSLRVSLKKGSNTLVLSYEPENENMNAQGINRAMLDYVRLIKMQ